MKPLFMKLGLKSCFGCTSYQDPAVIRYWLQILVQVPVINPQEI